MWFRGIAAIMLVATTVGCGQFGVAGPDDLGLVQRLSPTLQVTYTPRITSLGDEGERNRELSKWIVVSDDKCNKYLLQLSRGIRDSRLATDAVGTILSGLATILAPVGTKTALSGAATITLGVGGDFQSDLFAQQACEVLISAVQTVRARARKTLQANMQTPYVNYTFEQGLVDVQRYDQETCNLNVGLNELRASLLSGPETGRFSTPILPAPAGPPTSIFTPSPPPVAPPPPTDLGVRGGMSAMAQHPRQSRERVEPRSTSPAPVGQNYSRFIEGPVTFLSEDYLNGVFAALCVSRDDINDLDPAPTTARIRAFQDWSRRAARDPIPSATGRLTPDEIVRLASMPRCNKKRFENIYEANLFTGQDINSSPRLIKAMENVVPLASGEKPPTTVKEVRQRIPAVRDALANKLVLKDPALSNQLTNDLVNVLFGLSTDIPVSGSPVSAPGQ
jgi:hypothetical protein